MSIAVAAAAMRLGVPAALLIGPLVVAVAFGIGGARLALPPVLFTVAQALLGTLIAQTISAPVVATITQNWPVMILVACSTVAAAGLSGWLLARFSSVPASTAAWGSSPGAASAMTAMSADDGADARIVAFMQYLRVTIVVLSAALVAKILPHVPVAVAARPVMLAVAGSAPISLVPFLQTLGIAIGGGLIGRSSRIPAGVLLVPMLGGGILHAFGLVAIDLPWWLVGAAYLTIGWSVGLRYTGETLRYVISILPQLLLFTAVLIALCSGSATLLVFALHVDPLTAYLATTPGGLDSAAVLALGSGSNVSLVIAVQTFRLFLVIVSGPALAKIISRTADRALSR